MVTMLIQGTKAGIQWRRPQWHLVRSNAWLKWGNLTSTKFFKTKIMSDLCPKAPDQFQWLSIQAARTLTDVMKYLPILQGVSPQNLMVLLPSLTFRTGGKIDYASQQRQVWVCIWPCSILLIWPSFRSLVSPSFILLIYKMKVSIICVLTAIVYTILFKLYNFIS